MYEEKEDRFSDDTDKLLTKINYLGTPIKIDNLMDLPKYINKDMTVRLVIVLDAIKTSKENRKEMFSCYTITRVDIIDAPRSFVKNEDEESE